MIINTFYIIIFKNLLILFYLFTFYSIKIIEVFFKFLFLYKIKKKDKKHYPLPIAIIEQTNKNILDFSKMILRTIDDF